MAKGDDIQERLIDFAVRIVRLRSVLPSTVAARHIGDQMLRSGTSPAAHYAEARGAESTRDFVHKLKICLKELNETYIWIEILQRSGIVSTSKTNLLREDCRSLSRIINASIRTINQNRSKL